MITSKFSKSYDDVLTQSYLFHSGLTRDLAQFTAFSPIFDAAYVSDFLNLIDEAGALPTNEEDLNNQVNLLAEVESKMEESRVLFRKLVSYIRVKWGNSDTISRAFGANLYEKARKSAQKMVNLLELANRAAESTKYKADLIATGFTQLDITALLTLSGELNTVYNNQQEFLQLTADRTEERIIAFNKVWDVMVQINFASKEIFKDSPALIEYYLLYPEGPGPGSLTAPTNLTFYFPTKTFSWDAVDNATSYQLQWSVDGDEANYVEIFSGTDTSFIYNEIASPINYLRVRARNNNGYSEFSEVLIQGYFAVLPPPVLDGVDLVPNTTNSVRLVWNEVPSATKYRVYRSTVNIGDPAGSWVLVSQENGTSLIETVGEGKRYYYRLTAENAYQASVVSSSVFIDVDVAP